ncbi:hypothetical protein [Streptomyces longisporus]|uniref:hypothetical protein n=1 Tax=Streptomyces longisporus TaxID=1948 RepID=UPI0031DC2DEF
MAAQGDEAAAPGRPLTDGARAPAGRPGSGLKCSATGLSADGYFLGCRLPLTALLFLLWLRRATKQRPPAVH